MRESLKKDIIKLINKKSFKEDSLMVILSLLDELVNTILKAEEKFLSNPKDLHTFETSVKSSTDQFAREILGGVLSELNQLIYDSSWRMDKYNVQRTDQRTLISSFGDVTFDCTYYKNLIEGGYSYLLEDVVGISCRERFTEAAEVAILTEALKTSYREAAKVIPTKSKISPTTVMNKVHQIADEMPPEEPHELKKVDYLFIEADEDHVAEQHGRWRPKEDNKGFICRLVYVYEYKREDPNCKGRNELVGTFRFSGLYPGNKGVTKLWEKVADYIDNNYDYDELKQIFITGDGAGWIKSGANIIDKSLYCADKFHLMKYINAASNQMLDEKDIAKSKLYKYLGKKEKKKFREYTNKMMASANNQEPIEKLQTYVLGNWGAVMRTLHDERVQGCSAEGHVSHDLSHRLSSRPMGWSQEGADRMAKLRIYEKNFGRAKIIKLVKVSREKRIAQKTGTDDIEIKPASHREVMAEYYDQARSYLDRWNVTIGGATAKKTAAIRTQLNLL